MDTKRLIDQKWIVMARKRLTEMRFRSAEAMSGDKVFERIWKGFDR